MSSSRDVSWFVAASKSSPEDAMQSVRVAVLTDAGSVKVVAVGPEPVKKKKAVPFWRGSSMSWKSQQWVREGESDASALRRLVGKTARGDASLDARWECNGDVLAVRVSRRVGARRHPVWETHLSPAPWSEVASLLDLNADRARTLEKRIAALSEQAALKERDLKRRLETIAIFQANMERVEHDIFEACALILNRHRTKDDGQLDKINALETENRKLRLRLLRQDDDDMPGSGHDDDMPMKNIMEHAVLDSFALLEDTNPVDAPHETSQERHHNILFPEDSRTEPDNNKCVLFSLPAEAFLRAGPSSLLLLRRWWWWQKKKRTCRSISPPATGTDV